MPIVSGNEPRSPRRRSGTNWSWLIFLAVVFGPTLLANVRRLVAGRISNDQLLIIGGGVVALVALGLIVQRVSRARERNTTSLPTSYTPPATPSLPRTPGMRSQFGSNQSYVPSPPRFEPIITGKVVLAGVLLALVLAGAGLLILSFG